MILSGANGKVGVLAVQIVDQHLEEEDQDLLMNQKALGFLVPLCMMKKLRTVKKNAPDIANQIHGLHGVLVVIVVFLLAEVQQEQGLEVLFREIIWGSPVISIPLNKWSIVTNHIVQLMVIGLSGPIGLHVQSHVEME